MKLKSITDSTDARIDYPEGFELFFLTGVLEHGPEMTARSLSQKAGLT